MKKKSPRLGHEPGTWIDEFSLVRAKDFNDLSPTLKRIALQLIEEFTVWKEAKNQVRAQYHAQIAAFHSTPERKQELSMMRSLT